MHCMMHYIQFWQTQAKQVHSGALRGAEPDSSYCLTNKAMLPTCAESSEACVLSLTPPRVRPTVTSTASLTGFTLDLNACQRTTTKHFSVARHDAAIAATNNLFEGKTPWLGLVSNEIVQTYQHGRKTLQHCSNQIVHAFILFQVHPA